MRGRPGFGQDFRARRGDVRYLILQVLQDGSANGYTIMKKAAERTEGAWAPSPGSVYPTLSMLRDEGLVNADDGNGYTITDAGRALIEGEEGESFRERLDAASAHDQTDDLGPATQKLMAALVQLRVLGDEAARATAAEKVNALRRELYLLLSEQ
jgi:DNA-binding PadR family transcriptional regulator